MRKFKTLLIISGVFIIVMGCGNTSSSTETSLSSTNNENNQNAVIEEKRELSSSEESMESYDLSDYWTDLKGVYNETKDIMSNAVKESFSEVKDAYGEIYEEIGINSEAYESLKESYEMLSKEKASLSSYLGETKTYIQDVIQNTKKDVVRELVDTIESPELQTIIEYALVIKDLNNNYSDYSVEKVTPEFKEQMDSFERVIVNLAELGKLDEGSEITRELSAYKGIIDAATDYRTAYTEHDNLSEADREYYDIVMLRIVGMLISMGGE